MLSVLFTVALTMTGMPIPCPERPAEAVTSLAPSGDYSTAPWDVDTASDGPTPPVI